MMAALFGAMNRPRPKPTSPSAPIKNQPEGWVSPKSASAPDVSAIPTTVSGRVPMRSANLPATGAMHPRARGNTVRTRPTRPGLTPRVRSKKKGTANIAPNNTPKANSPETTPVANGVRRSSERSSIGSRQRRSWLTNPTPVARATRKRAIDRADVHPQWSPNEMATRRVTIVGTNEPQPDPIEWRARLEVSTTGQEDPGGHGADDAGGDVDEEDQPPASGRQQQSTHDWAEREPEGLGSPLNADASAQPFSGHGQVDDGDAVGLEHGCTDGLDHPEAVEADQTGCEGAQG